MEWIIFALALAGVYQSSARGCQGICVEWFLFVLRHILIPYRLSLVERSSDIVVTLQRVLISCTPISPIWYCSARYHQVTFHPSIYMSGELLALLCRETESWTVDLSQIRYDSLRRLKAILKYMFESDVG